MGRELQSTAAADLAKCKTEDDQLDVLASIFTAMQGVKEIRPVYAFGAPDEGDYSCSSSESSLSSTASTNTVTRSKDTKGADKKRRRLAGSRLIARILREEHTVAT